jgi:hypothetical protein
VLFAGAGISTEAGHVLPRTLFDDIRAEVRPAPVASTSFPDVMSRFASRPNGRRLLLRKIRDRFAYIEAFPELYGSATRFHRALSTMHCVEHIVTTNWDDYFERECQATPFVTAEDFAFWDVPGRKVFKLHGSVNSYGSLVATREDYDLSYERLSGGLVGSSLRMMLATRTLVYIGFSFSDSDFLRIHELLTSEMRGLRPQSYVVTLDRANEGRFRSLGLVPIITDGTYFIEQLKARLVRARAMVPDSAYAGVRTLLLKTTALHARLGREIDLQRHPDLAYTLFYQDGLVHACGRILSLRDSGYYSHACNPEAAARTYDHLRRQAIRERNYARAAYMTGYMDGNIYFLSPAAVRRYLPQFFVYGYEGDIRSISSLKRILPRAPRLHQAASRAAQRLVRERAATSGLELHHLPWFAG